MRALLRMLTLLAVAGLAGCGAKEPTGIKSPEDVNRAEVRIGIMTGSTAEGLSKAQFPNAKLFLFDDIMDAMAALKANQVDVSITAYPQALQIGKTNADLTMLPQRLDHEPTAAAVRKGNADLLKRICKGRSMIVIEHDMDFVKQIASKVTVMHQGKILAEGTMDQVQSDPKVIDVYLGH